VARNDLEPIRGPGPLPAIIGGVVAAVVLFWLVGVVVGTVIFFVRIAVIVGLIGGALWLWSKLSRDD
jgi:hypothetical protein